MFVLKRFVMKHFLRGCIEVHVIFDDPNRYDLSPKTVERERRDKQTTSDLNHIHSKFEDSLPPSSKWTSVLKCRECKHNLTTQLAVHMVQLVQPMLLPGKRFVMAGSFRDRLRDHAVCVEHGNPSTFTDERLTCNIEEGDMRVWMHCKYSVGTHKLLFSPDTDTYHVGMGLLEDIRLCECDVYVQINRVCDPDKYIHLSKLGEALHYDHCMATISPQIRAQILQTLYVVTGCDYVSYFHGIGKIKFLRVFFQHASFISNGQEQPGTLADITPERESLGFLSFVGLVGTVYFKLHLQAFVHRTPESHLQSFCMLDEISNSTEQHHLWLDDICKKTWARAKSPADEVPSFDALLYHWKRCVWVLHMWKQSLNNTVNLLPMTSYGWEMKDGHLAVKWESPENIENVESHVKYYLKGCGCKKSQCGTKWCGCKNQDPPHTCGPGCTCSPEFCRNQGTSQEEGQSSTIPNVSLDQEFLDASDDNDENDMHTQQLLEVDQIMKDVFGELSDSEILL